MTKPLSIYIHIPFCSKICPYCAFYKKKWDRENEELYVKALLEELRFYRERFSDIEIGTVFFGGGTPNLLRTENLKKMMKELKRFSWAADVEVTMEMNPGLSSVAKLRAIRQLGVNRCSLGVQSLNEVELKFLGRNHSVAHSLKSMEAVREAGFDNMSCDLMFGLPGSTEASLLATLETLLVYKPEHISTYNLSIEPGTPFKRRGQKRAPQEMEAAQYVAVMKRLSKARFVHYEVSNFAQSGHECQHNMAYWNFDDYIGLGPGAHSFFEGMRYHHARDLDIYIKQPIPKVFLQKSKRNYPLKEQIEDFVMVKLRLKKGVLFREIMTRFGYDFKKKNETVLSRLYEQRLIKKPGHRLEVTKKGLMVMDIIIGDIVSSLVFT